MKPKSDFFASYLGPDESVVFSVMSFDFVQLDSSVPVRVIGEVIGNTFHIKVLRNDKDCN